MPAWIAWVLWVSGAFLFGFLVILLVHSCVSGEHPLVLYPIAIVTGLSLGLGGYGLWERYFEK